MLSTPSSLRSYKKHKTLDPSSTLCVDELPWDDLVDTDPMAKSTPMSCPAMLGNESPTTKKIVEQHENPLSLDDEAILESVMDDKSTSEMLDVFGERLEEEMVAIENSEANQQQIRSTEHQETCIRIMYMGAASCNDKHLIFSKVAQALMLCYSYVPCNVFKERKRHIRRLMDGEENDNTIVDAYEDNGLAIIEGDFTWSTGRRKQALPYVRQLQGLGNNALSVVDEEEHDDEEKFITFSEKKGVDLCFYFFEDRQYTAVIEEEMATLWDLQKLGVPIFPILTSAAILDDDSGVGVVDRRVELADMLKLYRVQCVEIPMLFDVGPMPSFATQFKDQPLLILSIDQFIALDRRTVLSILHQQSVIPEDKKESSSLYCYHPPHTTDIPPAQTSSHDRKSSHQTTFWILLMLFNILLSLMFRHVASFRQESPKTFASLVMLHDNDSGVIIEIELSSSTGSYKTRHNLFACVDGPLATLEIHQDYAKVLTLQAQGDNIRCSSQNTTSIAAEKDQQLDTASQWHKIVQTTQFLLRHYPKLLDIMFTKAHA